MMQVVRLARLLACNMAWRATGSQRAGSRLLQGLSSEDESVRTIAAILLARGGDKAVALISVTIQERSSLRQSLVLAGTLGAQSLAPELEKFSNDPDPAVAAAAKEGLRRLEMRKHVRGRAPE